MNDAIQWPPERFFWAVLEAPAWRRSGLVPPGLLIEAADEFPLPVEDLQVVGAACGDGRVVICAARRNELAAVSAVSLTPQELPACVEAEVDPAALEMLAGEFEPQAMRRARMRRHTGLAGTVVACAALVAIGLGRRAEHWDNIASATRDARLQLAARAAPGVAPERLAMEVARLRTAADAAGGRPARDAALTLASLLDAWPRAAAATPQSIVVGDSGVSVSVSVEGEPSAFLSALRPPDGWTLDDPRLNAAGGVTRLTLQMRPVKEDSP